LGSEKQKNRKTEKQKNFFCKRQSAAVLENSMKCIFLELENIAISNI